MNLVDTIVKEAAEVKLTEVMQTVGLPLEAFISSKLKEVENLEEIADEYLGKFSNSLEKWHLSGGAVATSENGKAAYEYFRQAVEYLSKIYESFDAECAEKEISEENKQFIRKLIPSVVYMTVYSWVNQLTQVTDKEFLDILEDKVIKLDA